MRAAIFLGLVCIAGELMEQRKGKLSDRAGSLLAWLFLLFLAMDIIELLHVVLG